MRGTAQGALTAYGVVTFAEAREGFKEFGANRTTASTENPNGT
jgi:hypothetical protein